jgi:hypothetical protein
MRLPYVALADADEVEIGLIGVPWDGDSHREYGLSKLRNIMILESTP